MFIAHNELQPLQANNAEQLVNYIKWVSTAVLKSASAPPSQVQAGDNANAPAINVPIPAVPNAPSTAGDVW